jgi:geranylgeranyl pyrophosphate synthase
MKQFGLEMGAFVEVLHNASLMIDDIQDNSTKRRGEDCAHVKYGLAVSISSATSLYFLAQNWILQVEDEAVQGRLLAAVLKEMTCLHLGQNQDIVWNRRLLSEDFKYTESDYFTLCKHKTSGLLRMLVRIAEARAEGRQEGERGLRMLDLFDRVGILFQIIDDVLNLEQCTVSANKQARGEDIREGNQTIIVIHALAKGAPEDSKELARILRSHTKDQTEIENAIMLCEKAGSIEYARQIAKQMQSQLLVDIDTTFQNNSVRLLMKQVIAMIVDRSN